MTSKEVINELKKYCVDEYKLALEKIEKDLEVLEHLKLLFNGYKVLEKLNILYTDMYLLCKNGEDDVIKEWLND